MLSSGVSRLALVSLVTMTLALTVSGIHRHPPRVLPSPTSQRSAHAANEDLVRQRLYGISLNRLILYTDPGFTAPIDLGLRLP